LRWLAGYRHRQFADPDLGCDHQDDERGSDTKRLTHSMRGSSSNQARTLGAASLMRASMPWIALVDQVTWLTPSPQNLGLLTLNPPPGFTDVPYSVMTSYLGWIP
jgi:hypothetical protein